jgi:thiol:disulfide interchange protein
MIKEETYLTSLTKLRDRETLHDNAVEKGKKFLEIYKNSLEESKILNKHIFLLFYVTGCDGCNVVRYLMENNQEIKNILANYIVLQCDVSETVTKLTDKYNLYSYPSYFILDGEEKVIKKKIGIKVKNGPEKDFLDWLKN